MKKQTDSQKVPWSEAMSYGHGKTEWTDADWKKAADLVSRTDPATVPKNIEIPDLRPEER